MGFYGFVAVGIGAGLGAWLRWWLGILLNPVFPTLPFGTLAANLLGGYLVGLAVAFFSEHSGLPPEVRLFIITGFMGGLTTFSTFSAESVTLISRSEYLWAAAHVAVHVGGSLTMTMLGIATFQFLKSRGLA
ncbi:MAG: fluoride efflux transporter CrcB [Burkholderiales bacterium]|nr:fluoride efflux transporter CrcB [Burkholderiales bacterium]